MFNQSFKKVKLFIFQLSDAAKKLEKLMFTFELQTQKKRNNSLTFELVT